MEAKTEVLQLGFCSAYLCNSVLKKKKRPLPSSSSKFDRLLETVFQGNTAAVPERTVTKLHIYESGSEIQAITDKPGVPDE